MKTAMLGRVLLLDSDPSQREVLQARLRAACYEVVCATGGPEAWDMIEAEDFDVVVLDLIMEDMNAYEVMDRLRMRRRPPAVIVLASEVSGVLRMQALYGGASDFMQKPADPDEFLARVAVAIRQKRLLMDADREAERDELTGVGNRRGFDHQFAEEMARSERYHRNLTLVLFDADGLKLVNDRHGHVAGDELLRALAGVLKKSSRASDTVYRIGGDEFALLLPETDRRAALPLIARIQELLGAVRLDEGLGGYRLQARSGLASYPTDAANGRDLFQAADEALRAAKRERRSTPRRTGLEDHRPTVLVVEDDLDLARIMSVRLEGDGYQSYVVTTRADALAALHASKPHLVVLDRMLPDGDGLELLSEIREDTSLSDLPVLVLTGWGDSSSAMEGFIQGANAYLAKPYDPAHMKSAIDILLGESAR